MTARDEVTILQHAIETAIKNGFLQKENRDILAVDYVLDPPTIAVRFKPDLRLPNEPLYFYELFPLWDTDWAVAFWGKQIIGDGYFGLLPAWQYHQHKLLTFWQQKDRESYYNYIDIFLDPAYE